MGVVTDTGRTYAYLNGLRLAQHAQHDANAIGDSGRCPQPIDDFTLHPLRGSIIVRFVHNIVLEVSIAFADQVCGYGVEGCLNGFPLPTASLLGRVGFQLELRYQCFPRSDLGYLRT